MSQHLSGLPAWLVQRLSAVYMLIYTLAVVTVMALSPVADYTAWQSLFGHPLVAIATAMFFLALLLHAWVGVRDVILDYAGQVPAVRLLLLTVLGGWLIALAVWAVGILLMGRL